MSNIELIGVELEGGWNQVFEDVTFTEDISVQPLQAEHWGECISPPLTLPEILKWTGAHYPDASDLHCGMHVHVSVRKKLHYGKLQTLKFYEFFEEKLLTWADKMGLPPDHPLRTRLSGEGEWARFCWNDYRPQRQVHMPDKGHNDEGRRTRLNYCWNYLKTVEVRVLPMFLTKELALEAIKEVVGIFESYLDQFKGKDTIELKFTQKHLRHKEAA